MDFIKEPWCLDHLLTTKVIQRIQLKFRPTEKQMLWLRQPIQLTRWGRLILLAFLVQVDAMSQLILKPVAIREIERSREPYTCCQLLYLTAGCQRQLL